jgi:hypothetical protein
MPVHGAGQVKELAKGWGALPARYQMVVATSLAFVLCNMDKVSLSMLVILCLHCSGISGVTV